MAKMESGVLGIFSGKNGDVVGYKRGGVQCIRSIPRKKNTDHSPVRIAQMAKFGLLTKFLSPLSRFMNQAHKKTFKNISVYNKLCSLNMKEIVTGDYPDFKIDYHKVVVTKMRSCYFKFMRYRGKDFAPGDENSINLNPVAVNWPSIYFSGCKRMI